MATAQEAAVGFAKRLQPDDVAQVIDFSSQVRIIQGFTNDAGGARARDPQHHRGRLDGALQRDLHLAEGTEEDQGRRPRTRSGARRSSCSRTATTPRACCPTRKCSTWRSGPKPPSTRSGCAQRRETGRASFKEAEYVLKQLAQETGGRSFFPTSVQRAAEDLRADLAGAVDALLARLHLEEPAAERRLAADRRPHRAAGACSPARARGTTGRRLPDMRLVPAPLLRRRRGGVRRAISPGAHPRSDGSRPALLGGGLLAHTFLIGMQTVQAGHAPLVGTTAAISAFVWLLGLSYLTWS